MLFCVLVCLDWMGLQTQHWNKSMSERKENGQDEWKFGGRFVRLGSSTIIVFFVYTTYTYTYTPILLLTIEFSPDLLFLYALIPFLLFLLFLILVSCL